MPGKAKILLIDDDPDLVQATSSVLESKGYQVVAAEDGDVGLEKAAAEKPDLIILDVIMPRMDGFTACRKLKADPKLRHIPVLMLTVFPDDLEKTSIDLRQGMVMEAEDYIQKPVTPQQLLHRVEDLLK